MLHMVEGHAKVQDSGSQPWVILSPSAQGGTNV